MILNDLIFWGIAQLHNIFLWVIKRDLLQVSPFCAFLRKAMYNIRISASYNFIFIDNLYIIFYHIPHWADRFFR